MAIPRRKRRHQAGSIVLRSGKWYVRYYGPDRKQVNELLHAKDDEFHSSKCKPVRDAASQVMGRVNSELEETGTDQAVSDFFDFTYLPWVEANKKHSTIISYKQLWSQRLKPHFGSTCLAEYRTSDASKFLTGLADSGLGRNAISHIRSLASGIFSHAVNLGSLDTNPLREAKCLSKAKPPARAESYSLREVEDMVSSLAGRTDAQLLVALGAFLGLRPSEIAGLGWDCVDLEAGVLHLRRAYVRGVLGDLKTEGSAATLPLIEPVLGLMRLEAKKSRRTWVLENQAGKPKDLKDMVRKVVLPAIRKWNVEHEQKIEWKGLYALRRTASSLLWSLTGDTQASQQVLRHSSPSTTIKHYLVADRTKMESGLRLLEAKLLSKTSS